MEILIVIFIVSAIVLYFLPAIIAGQRKAANGGGITLINIFFGWTVIGWIAALIWACTDSPESAPRRPCPFCAEKIMAQAIVCPHCRRDMPAEIPVTSELAPVIVPDSTSSTAIGWIGAGLIVVLLGSAIWMTTKQSPASATAGREQPITATGIVVSPCSEFGDDLGRCAYELGKRGVTGFELPTVPKACEKLGGAEYVRCYDEQVSRNNRNITR